MTSHWLFPSILAASLLMAAAVEPQPARDTVPVVYEIAFSNAVHHEAEVRVVFANVGAGPLELRMSRSSPGRYALHEFAKNVYRVKAVDSRNRELTLSRPNPHQWNVSGHDGKVVLTYTLFGDRADGTYAAIDLTHAHLNIPATFMWARGMQSRPVRITFRPPAGSNWKVATQLMPTSLPFTFTAPGLQYFMDSPTELSAHDVRSWPVASGGRTQAIRFALHHNGSAVQFDSFVVNVKKVVAEQEAMWGELPRFDHGAYTFIADYLPYVSGDGMEHRNSTVLTATRPLATGAAANLRTVSHEFFHAWNVERIRPGSLEPFNFEEANISEELWLAEGFTTYYTDLFIRRAGVTDVAEYAQAITGILNVAINSPGRQFFSPTGMSQQAPFVDAAASIDPHNKANTFISYYTYGAAIGLLLDLDIRSKFAGRSLDDFMRRMWLKYGKTERPYDLDDVRRTLGEAVGSSAYADDVFRRYIRGRELPAADSLLALGGMVLRKAGPGTAWFGDLNLAVRDSAVVVGAPVLIGTPAYAAGITQGDVLVSLAGRTLTAAADANAVLASMKPGDRLAAVIVGRAGRREAAMILADDPRLEVVTYEAAGLPVTTAIRSFRDSWMGSKARR